MKKNVDPFMPSVPLTGHCKSSAGPDQTPQNATSDQGVHCWHLGQKSTDKNLPGSPYNGNEPVQIANVEESTRYKWVKREP